MSCADTLSRNPNFSITLVEAVGYCGGQAFAIPIDKQQFGASWLNQGVQGGSYAYHHTLTFLAQQGLQADPVELQVSFGKGETFWTNVYPTRLLARYQREVRRFCAMVKAVRWLEPVVGLAPIGLLMLLLGFPSLFVNVVALPMVALFLGTGNATPHVPVAMLERLCTSRMFGMWYPLDQTSVVSNRPPMVVFPNLSKFYGQWRKRLEGRGVGVRLNTEVTKVVKRGSDGVVVKLVRRAPKDHGHSIDGSDAAGPEGREEEEEEEYSDEVTPEVEEEYDELVLCVL
jgi:hypothetical protein